MAPKPGEVIGQRYRIVREIGRGGMGRVFEAENIVTYKRVALKWMRSDLGQGPSAVERFRREAQAASVLRHPNVVDVYDIFDDDEDIYQIMELLEGETLTALLARGSVPIGQFVELLLPAMRAVAKAHQLGIVHRDIKPDNIFLSRHDGGNGEIVTKVLDFGVSKMRAMGNPTMTNTGAAIGTPLYMPIEQLNGSRDVDGRADIYAFGVVLYEAATGRPPYEASTFTELIMKIASEQPPPPQVLCPELPLALTELIEQCMAREREKRPASMELLIERLSPFASASNESPYGVPMPGTRPPSTRRGEASGAQQPSSLRPVIQTVRSTVPESGWSAKVANRRHGMLFGVGGGLLGILVTGLIGVLFWNPEADKSESASTVVPPPEPVRVSAAPGAPGSEPRSRLATAVHPAGGEAGEHGEVPEGHDPEDEQAPRSPARRQVNSSGHPAKAASPIIDAAASSKPRASAGAVAGAASPAADGRSDVPAGSAPRSDSKRKPPAQAEAGAAATKPPVGEHQTKSAQAWEPVPMPSRNLFGRIFGSDDRAARRARMLRVGPRYRTITALKRAFQQKRVDREEFGDTKWVLAIWRDHRLNLAKQAYSRGELDKAAYHAAVESIDRAYEGK